ncbi:MAG: hypothetical protein ABIH04_04140 [Planctomycetota bacterium]
MFGLSNKQFVITLVALVAVIAAAVLIWLIATADERAVKAGLERFQYALLQNDPIAAADAISPAYNYEDVTCDMLKSQVFSETSKINCSKLEVTNIRITFHEDRAEVEFNWNTTASIPHTPGFDTGKHTNISGHAKFEMTKKDGRWLITKMDVYADNPRLGKLPLSRYLRPALIV